MVKYDKRILLPRGVQQKFIESVQIKLSSNLDIIADKIGVHRRTLFDWRREKFLISQSAINKLSKLSGLLLPPNMKIKTPFWYTSVGAKKGWAVVSKKYGRVPVDEEYRKKRWREWWEKEGKFKKHPIINKPLPIRRPEKSEELAEFTGIAMGDGGISKYQVTITLHRKDDKEFAIHVKGLIKKLFGIEPAMYDVVKNSVVNIVVSRGELVQFCTKELGLPLGNKVKQKFDIPNWIKCNDKFLKFCVRGLVDTDGSVFSHKYKVNGKQYEYKKICFCSASLPLNMSIFNALSKWGFQPRLARKNGKIREVRLDSKRDIFNYFNIIGSSNPKHLKRYGNWYKIN